MPFVLLLALAYLGKWLVNSLKVGWDDLWHEIFTAVAAAEDTVGAGQGLVKQGLVVDAVMGWLSASGTLGGWQKIVLSFAVKHFIDALVSGLNETLGNDWVGKANEVKDMLEGKWPIFKPAV